LVALSAFLGAAFAGFVALGIWQVQRLSWKLDLIERVESRVQAPPGPAPGRSEWPQVSAARDEYRHVRLDGRFLSGRDTRVQAVTEAGAGFWLLSPFEASDGTVVLVNRGFVPQEWRGNPASAANTQVTGLLRLSEPGGAFLRRNAPAGNRWYSRDVQAIAAARRLRQVAPYFVDADRGADAAGWPRGGLTVIHFRNNHLVYALTWFALALMAAVAGGYVVREERRRRAAH
jgi:surfeit locus 1 family protein